MKKFNFSNAEGLDLCKDMKKVRSNQSCISINSFTKFGKTVFSC